MKKGGLRLRFGPRLLNQAEAMERAMIERPVRAPTMGADYAVPTSTAVTVGVILASLVCLLYSRWFDKPDGGWIVLWLELFLGFTFITYVLTLKKIWGLLHQALELTTGRDWDGDGSIGGRPIVNSRRGSTPVDRHVGGKIIGKGEEVEDVGDGDGEWTKERIVAEFPLNGNEQIIQWFVRVSAQIGTSSRTWEPVLTRRRYNEYRDSLIKAGWADWSYVDEDGNPIKTQGWEYVSEPETIIANIK